MLNIKKLLPIHSRACYESLDKLSGESRFFESMGWSQNQFEIQLLKENNFSLGIFNNNKLDGFLIGDLISIENITEYEILLIYVIKEKRNLGNASKLLTNISFKKLEKIYLEVAENNIGAIKLYENNGFRKIGIRKNYYNFSNQKKLDAYFFEKYDQRKI